ncbi:MAG TPA: 4'-phosphopantetheinyl transferase superfamily protein, partial [Caldilineaceae bacterium]|nr:4'-phosphopantetheinyl transferase superfamily protein [Caldilineaceae bacterium]
MASDNAVHIWSITLDGAPAFLRQLQQTLSADEQERARRFQFAWLRRRFVVARGMLRTLLGCYLEQAPTAVHLVYNQYGKPALGDGEGEESLRFNLSHSGDLALLAFTRQAELGIDLEWIHPDIDYAEIAQRFFSPLEWAALCAVPAPQQLAAFYRCWTRKEAYIK